MKEFPFSKKIVYVERKKELPRYGNSEGEEMLLSLLNRKARQVSWAVALDKLLNFSYFYFCVGVSVSVCVCAGK